MSGQNRISIISEAKLQTSTKRCSVHAVAWCMYLVRVNYPGVVIMSGLLCQPQ